MTEVIYIDVVGNSTNNATKINLDDRPLGMTYPMDSVSERQFAYNKYNRWFKNSVSLKSDKIMPQLNDMVQQALDKKRLVLGSEYHNHVSHVDVVLDYLINEFKRRGFNVNTNRAEVQP